MRALLNQQKSNVSVKVNSINVDVVRSRFAINTEIHILEKPDSLILVCYEVARDRKDRFSTISSQIQSKTDGIAETELKQIVGTVESAMYSYLARKKSFTVDTHADTRAQFDFELIRTPTHVYSVFPDTIT